MSCPAHAQLEMLRTEIMELISASTADCTPGQILTLLAFCAVDVAERSETGLAPELPADVAAMVQIAMDCFEA